MTWAWPIRAFLGFMSPHEENSAACSGVTDHELWMTHRPCPLLRLGWRTADAVPENGAPPGR